MAVALLGIGPVLPKEDRRQQTVFVSWDARAHSCTTQVGNAVTGDINTPDGETAFAGAIVDKGATLHVLAKSGYELPYACTVKIQDALWHNGFHGRVEFGLTEMPPTPPAP